MVVINSRFCAYDDEVGFRINPSAQDWASKPGSLHIPNSQGGYAYKLESYQEHIGDMLRIYQRDFQSRLAFIDARLGRLWGTPPRGLDKAIRIAIALHDTAKMDRRWQRWVRLYQQGIGEPIRDESYMAVHTHWNPDDPRCVAARNAADRREKRPHHAGESAIAAEPIIEGALAQDEPLVRAVITAISRHHSASAHSFDTYTLHPQAANAVARALALAGFPEQPPDLLMTPPAVELEEMFSQRYFRQQVLYLLVARYLRLTDSLSQAAKG